jgi:hypothetical protein
MLIKRYPFRPRHDHDRPDPGYGVGYRPDWPSILSVAHDVDDGGALFVVTDRPCAIVPGPLALPLSAAGLGALAATQVRPVKFRLTLNGAVPAGAAWSFGAGASSLIDPVSNHAPNPASGTCADVPGPYPPPGAARVVAVSVGADGQTVTMVLDRPLAMAGPPPYEMDGSVEIAGMSPAGVTLDAPQVLAFDMGSPVEGGLPWEIHSQPPWLATPIAAPQGGTLG